MIVGGDEVPHRPLPVPVARGEARGGVEAAVAVAVAADGGVPPPPLFLLPLPSSCPPNRLVHGSAKWKNMPGLTHQQQVKLGLQVLSGPVRSGPVARLMRVGQILLV